MCLTAEFPPYPALFQREKKTPRVFAATYHFALLLFSLSFATLNNPFLAPASAAGRFGGEHHYAGMQSILIPVCKNPECFR